MNILLVSSVSLSMNPRIYKELQLAHKLNHAITFVGFKHGDWSDERDAEIQREYPSVKFIYLDATRRNYIKWLYFSLLYIFCKCIWPLNPSSLKLTANASSKRTAPILSLLKKLASKEKYDLILGHTLPALYPCFKFKQITNCNFAFDIEDYHPGELIASDKINEKKRREILLQKLLPLAVYVSAASKLIAETTQVLVPGLKIKTVLNFFSKDEFVPPTLISTDKIKLVWFSQNITAGRGLELILSVWDDVKSFCELTLIGKVNLDFYETEIKRHKNIIILTPFLQQNLHQNLSLYDIGLALEVDNIDLNKGIAISNKLLAYYQAGLYIVATDTEAQQEFINQHKSHGMLIQQTSQSIQKTLITIHQNIKQIRNERINRFAKTYFSSWETESAIIKKEWERLNRKKVLFVSSLNLALNPRICKEIKLAQLLNYEIEFIGFDIRFWKDDFDNKIKEEFSDISISYISATRKPFFQWFIATLVETSSKILYFIFKQNTTINAYASTKRSFMLNRFLKSNLKNNKFDFIVTHTLSTLYAVQKYAVRNNCPFGFDVEDFHPGEKIFFNANNEKKRRELLMRRLLPSAAYITGASPLISKAVENMANVKVTTVLNYFPSEEFVTPAVIKSNKIKLVWFSQNINAGRGLELVFSSWQVLKENFELTLIGTIDNKFYCEWVCRFPDIIIKKPLPQKELHISLSHFDVGLAIDVDNDDYNRTLAITNKILAYYQAGLYILATDTLAQQNFIKNNSLHGILTKQNPSSMYTALSEIVLNKYRIREQRLHRFTSASKFSWEHESIIIKDKWGVIQLN